MEITIKRCNSNWTSEFLKQIKPMLRYARNITVITDTTKHNQLNHFDIFIPITVHGYDSFYVKRIPQFVLIDLIRSTPYLDNIMFVKDVHKNDELKRVNGNIVTYDFKKLIESVY